ncbi:Sensor histidine kinase (plasmid) [Acidisarcina polymorpha]|uniref:histidine kinase n=1 Tax=Acidisarcina polymorpha TaxID=2211140 RepID=A0A2Z5GA76_9BACT|nr:sensor histidine kinase [Acidisarcina polymorpha]AXC16041.1 Sensor histidine kinase [Acidisarcina polymorpha]
MGSGTRTAAAFLLFLVCSSFLAHAQYRANLWTADEGLPQGAFRGVAQTSDGYLWLSTLDGLARFDGIRFFLFDRENSPGIESNRFTGLRRGVGDDLWMISEAGVTRYHQGSFQTIYNPRKDYNSIIFSEMGDEHGHIWIQLKDRILQWDERTQRFIDITPKDMRIPYKDIKWAGGAWGVVASQLYVFFKGQFHIYALPKWLPRDAVAAIAADDDGTFWLRRKDGRYVSSRDGVFVLHSGEIFIPHKDSHGNIWQVQLGSDFFRSVRYSSAKGEQSLSFGMMFEDREGTLWFARDGVGLYQMERQQVRTLSREQGLETADIYSLLKSRAGGMWIGGWPNLILYDEGRFTNYTVNDFAPGNLITALLEDSSGKLWVGTHGGLRVLTEGKFQRPPTGLVLPEHSIVQTMYQDREGTLWFGTNGGLVSYRDGKSHTYSGTEGVSTRDLNVITQSASGSLWFGGYQFLARYDHGRFTSLSRGEFLARGAVWALYEDPQGILWIGTYDNGLLRLQNEQVTHFSTRNGLFDNGAFAIQEDDRGNLWISSHHGIYRVKKQELNDVAAGKRSRITSIVYGKRDGMLNIECNGGIAPASAKDNAGRLWFPTQNGIAVIDPASVSPGPPAPKVVIESVLVDQVQTSNARFVCLAPDQHNLEIDYTSPSLIKSDQITFRYKLLGLDPTWTDMGTRRRLYFSHLQPGKYTLQLIAANIDGVWNTDPQELSIHVLAPFYRTEWFMMTLLLGVVLLTIYMWRRRVSMLQRAERQQRTFSQELIASQERERKRIAAELHDSLGQRLIVINNLALMTLLERRARADEGEEPDPMEEISAEAQIALDETRQISYNLRPFQLDRLGLAKAVEALAHKASIAGRFKVIVEIGDIDQAFPEELRINFYRIVQEALTNIMKHAEATCVMVKAVRDPDRITLVVQDNGHGYPAESNRSAAALGGFGAIGMAERATLLGGTITTRSELNQGTTVTAEFVLSKQAAV